MKEVVYIIAVPAIPLGTTHKGGDCPIVNVENPSIKRRTPPFHAFMPAGKQPLIKIILISRGAEVRASRDAGVGH